MAKNNSPARHADHNILVVVHQRPVSIQTQSIPVRSTAVTSACRRSSVSRSAASRALHRARGSVGRVRIEEDAVGADLQRPKVVCASAAVVAPAMRCVSSPTRAIRFSSGMIDQSSPTTIVNRRRWRPPRRSARTLG